MEIKAMIKNDCTFCFKALELQRALDLGLIAERNRCNEKIKAIEYEKQVLSDRLGIAELGYIDFIEYLFEQFFVSEERAGILLEKLEEFNNKHIAEAMRLNEPINKE